MLNLLAVLAGALLFLWPAAVNRYPIVFSDTGGFLEQAMMPDVGWDKPWVYGPFLTPFHAGLTLWPAVLAQAAILSALLWLALLALRGRRDGTRTAHLVLCAVLAGLGAAPWFASTLMPDIFAPIVVLALFLLSSRTLSRPARWLVGIVAMLAIASHLAHLVLAAGCIAVLGVLRWRWPWRPALPLAAALGLLLLGNLVGHRRLAVSPYGSVFALARLVADGPAATVIRERCPAAGWRVCAWRDRLPADSDDFLWDPHGPVWADSYGPLRIAPEASEIVALTLRTELPAVLRAAAGNAATQVMQAQVGDTLGADHLDITITPRLLAYFPAAEVARFEAGRQAQGRLRAVAAPLNPVYSTALVLGTLATAALAAWAWRRDREAAVLALLVLAALVANAASTGALSHPHDRYQARIAWLVLVPPVCWLLARRRGL